MPSAGELLDVTTLARNFPDTPDNLLQRENLLETIDSILASSTTLIILEGNEGIGKTILLANFCRRHSKSTAAIFIRASSKVSYSQGYVRLIVAEQIAEIIGVEIPRQETLTDTFLQASYFRLQRRFARHGSNVYIVIDGLSEIPTIEQADAVEQILALVPLGLPGFKFIISGEEGIVPRRVLKGMQVKSYTIAPFLLEETKQYLQSHSLSEQEIYGLHRLCQGNPGRLAIVDRLLQSGGTAEDVLGADPRNLPQFIAEEWARIPESNNHLLLLACICFGFQEFAIAELSGITGLEEELLTNLIGEIPFLRITPNLVVEICLRCSS